MGRAQSDFQRFVKKDLEHDRLDGGSKKLAAHLKKYTDHADFAPTALSDWLAKREAVGRVGGGVSSCLLLCCLDLQYPAQA